MADDHVSKRFALGAALVVQGVALFYLIVAVLPLALEADRPQATQTAAPCRAAPASTAPPRAVASPSPSPPVAVAGTPTPSSGTSPGMPTLPRDLGLRVFRTCVSVSSDSALLLLVVLVGALGALVHATTSFARHVARKSFDPAYYWWYILRTLVGAALAAIFYFVLRGGLLSVAADDTAPNVYGITAVAALAGLFSYPAMNRLEAVFDRIGNTTGDRATRADAAAPVIVRVAPSRLPVGAGERLVTIEGTGFGANPGVRVGDERRDTDAVLSSTGIRLTLREADVASAGELEVRVIANNRWSDPATVTIR